MKSNAERTTGRARGTPPRALKVVLMEWWGWGLLEVYGARRLGHGKQSLSPSIPWHSSTMAVSIGGADQTLGWMEAFNSETSGG